MLDPLKVRISYWPKSLYELYKLNLRYKKSKIELLEASILVDSALSNIPLPRIVLASKQGYYQVVRGSDCLNILFSFMNNEFSSIHHPFLFLSERISGKYFKDLDRSCQRRIEGRRMDIYMIERGDERVNQELERRLE